MTSPFKLALVFLVSTALLCGASKAELELKGKLAAAQAKIVAQEKENAILQEALKNSASDHAQLAAAARDKNQLKASLDALTAQSKNSQQETGRIATQAANQATGQASLAAAQLALRSKAELAKAVALVNASNKRQAATAERVANDAVAVNEATAADVKESVKDVKESVNTSNAAVNTNVAKVGDKVDDMALRLEETKQAAHHDNLLLYIGALGGVLAFGTTLLKFVTDYRSMAQTKTETRDHRKLELEKIDEVKNASKAAEVAANSVNQKIATVGLMTKDGSQLKPEAVEAEVNGYEGG